MKPPLLALASQSTPTHIFKDIPAGKEEKLSSQISVEYVLVSLLTRKRFFQMSSYIFELPLSAHFPHGSNKINTCAGPTVFVFDLCACGFIYTHTYYTQYVL